MQDPRAAERGLQPHRPVLERLVPVLIRLPGAGPGVDLPGQPGQVRAALRGAQQDRIRVRAAILRQLIRPAADRPRERLRHLPGCQRRRDLQMRGRPADPRGVADRGAPGGLGPVDQPPPRAVIRIRAVPLPGGERGQHRRPRRGAYRMGLLQHLQAGRLGLGGHRGGIRRGQVAQPGADHLHRLAGGGRGGTHLGRHLPPGMLAGRWSWGFSFVPAGTGTPAGHVSRFSVRFYRMTTTFSGKKRLIRGCYRNVRSGLNVLMESCGVRGRGGKEGYAAAVAGAGTTVRSGE